MQPVRVAAAFIAAGALAGSVVLTLLWLLRPETYWFAVIASAASYAVFGYLLAVLLLTLLVRRTPAPLRRWVVAAIALGVAGSGFHAVLLAPMFLGDHPTGRPDLTVMSLNMHLGQADAGQAVRLIRDEGVDVVVLSEVTPALAADLAEAGIASVLRYSAGEAATGAAGTMVFSALPLGADERLIGVGHGVHRVRVDAPDPFWLVAVHLSQPLSGKGLWRPDWDVLNQVLPELDGPVLAVGDFNSTLEHGPMRTLLGRGFTDAAEDANAGFQPTWPGRGLVAIDHVLFTAPYGAVRTETFEIAGTDHRALVAGLAR